MEKKEIRDTEKKELRHLSRLELLELLLEQTHRAEDLEERVKELEAQLKKREIAKRKAGTLAEAALQINEVFAAADAAARQYYWNVVRLTDMQLKQNEDSKNTKQSPDGTGDSGRTE